MIYPKYAASMTSQRGGLQAVSESDDDFMEKLQCLANMPAKDFH